MPTKCLYQTIYQECISDLYVPFHISILECKTKLYIFFCFVLVRHLQWREMIISLPRQVSSFGIYFLINFLNSLASLFIQMNYTKFQQLCHSYDVTLFLHFIQNNIRSLENSKSKSKSKVKKSFVSANGLLSFSSTATLRRCMYTT